MAKVHHSPAGGTTSSLEPLIERVNHFSADHYWDLGKFLVEKVIPAALKEGVFAEQILKRMADMPGFKFPYTMLKQCQRYYSYYPDVEKRPLPEVFYFELATKVEESRKRDHYEKQAIAGKWTISDLQKKIRDDELARREDEKTRYGFDLKERNIWSVDSPDPRFGKPNTKGRLPGQIVANALFYYTEPGWVVVDPMAGSGTTGDVIDSLPCFKDRTYRMYDSEPGDDRIKRANILQTGIPEQTGTVNYIFLDPPHDFYPRGTEPEFSPATAMTDTITKFKTLLRECSRVLKSGGRVSVIAEPTIGRFGIVDFPFEITRLARELGLESHSKVYLPRRSDGGRGIGTPESTRNPLSECREMITFEKP